MNKDTEKGAMDALHRMEEEHLASVKPQEARSAPDPESTRMLHELLVHQVELEMQNEELREVRAELETNSGHLTELYEFAPVAYFSLAGSGVIRQVNLLGARMLGGASQNLIGCRFGDFVSAGNRRKFDRFLTELFAGEAPPACEVTLMRHEQELVIVKITGRLSPNGQFCRMAAMDITEQRCVEETMRERNEDLNRIFNLSADLIGIANMAGRFVRLNPAFGRLLGHPIEDLIDRSLFEFVHPEDHEATRMAISDLKQGKDVLDFVNRQLCRDGSCRWLEWRVTPISGELICALGRDITDRKLADDSLRMSEQQFRSIVEASPMAMYLYQLEDDNRLVLIGANPAADEETGINHGSLYGKTVEEAFPGLVGTPIPELYKQVARGDQKTQSFVIRYDDNRISGHFDVRVFQTRPRAIVVAFMDISERITAEQALKKAQDELELRVQRRTAQLQERTRQLRALAHELTRAEESERRRIAGLIHDDLQQTLVAASLNLRMLRKGLGEPGAAQDLDRIAEILRDAVAISRTLTAELCPPVLQQSGLAAALRWLRAWCMDKYALDVRLEIHEDVEPGLEIGVLLFRAVRELLFNIVKHAGVKEAELRMWRGEDGGIGIEVSDKGAGFDPDVVRSREGVEGGFGLFNIRERLEMLGGRLGVESALGRGSTFTIRIPAHAIAEAVRDAPASAVEDDHPHPGDVPAAMAGKSAPCCGTVPQTIRIIVADDHAEVRGSLVRLLEGQRNFEVVAQAEDGQQALELARYLRPHIVLMDLNMPRMDGIQATRAIRREFPCIKVLGLSTHTDEAHRSAMIRAGAVDLLHKNVMETELLQALTKHAASPCAVVPPLE